MLLVILRLVNITHGVPQGTVLGPILFLIYINGLLNLNDLIISCFADDTAILLHSDNYNDLYKKANSLLHCVKVWFDNHMLMLNISKSKYMIF